MTARRIARSRSPSGFRYCHDHQPGEQGAERRAQCRRRGRDRRDRRLYRQRLRRRSGLAELSRRQDGGRRSRRVRRAELPAAGGQPGAGRGRGLAGRADARAAQTTRSPSTSPAATWPSAATCCCELGGFDPIYRAAGDDVDICWRFQDAGYTIGFSAAAMVWHFRRNTVKAYIDQQRGYGKAEALVYAKHPVPLQPLRPGEMARPHLRRPVGGAAAVAQAGDLFRHRSGAACSRRCTSRRRR